MECQHLDEFYELFVLGTLEGEKSLDLSEHVERQCPYCLEHLREATQTVYLLTSLARPLRPGPKQKAELLRRLSKVR